MAFDIKKTLGAIVPGIANLIGGPLAGMATTAVLGMFGIEASGNEKKDSAAMEQAVKNMTPEQAVELKSVEAKLETDLAQAGVDIYAIEIEDRKSARDMRVKLGGDLTVSIIAGLVVVAWGAVNFTLFTAEGELPNVNILMRAMGTLDAALLAVLYFFFGSSKGSSDKTRLDALK